MGGKKKLKKKCCGKFKKKGKHCSSCPITENPKKCAADKDYCMGCEVPAKSLKAKSRKKALKKDNKKTKKNR